MPLKKASAGSQQGQKDTAGTSAGLTTLPTETLELIFSNFCLHCRSTSEPNAGSPGASSLPDAYFQGHHQHHHQHPDEPSWYSLDRHALFSLCLMSRRLRDIAQPVLYHEFALGAGDSWRSTHYAWEGRLPSFLRTVTERRDLAHLVRRVCVHPFLLDKWCVTAEGEGAEANEAAAITALHHAARRLGIQRERYLDHFPKPPRITRDNSHEMSRVRSAQFLGLVIAALPNMEHLSLQSRSLSVQISGAALRAAGFTGLCLKILDVSSRSTANSQTRLMFSLNEEAIGVLLNSPGLSTLNLHMCGSTRYTPSPQKLRALRITHSRLSREDLVGTLSSCSQLDTFVYEAACPGMFGCGTHLAEATYPSDGNAHLEPSDVISLLGPRNNILKSLHLDFRHWAIEPSSAGGFTQPIPSLKGFRALENVLLNPSMIFPTRYDEEDSLATGGADRLTRLLPTTIVTLQLAGSLGRGRPWLTRALLGLAQAASDGAFARLKAVSCDVAEESSAGDGDQEAARLFENAGVRFGYREWPLSEATLKGSDVPPPLDPSEYVLMPLPTGDEDDDL